MVSNVWTLIFHKFNSRMSNFYIYCHRKYRIFFNRNIEFLFCDKTYAEMFISYYCRWLLISWKKFIILHCNLFPETLETFISKEINRKFHLIWTHIIRCQTRLFSVIVLWNLFQGIGAPHQIVSLLELLFLLAISKSSQVEISQHHRKHKEKHFKIHHFTFKHLPRFLPFRLSNKKKPSNLQNLYKNDLHKSLEFLFMCYHSALSSQRKRYEDSVASSVVGTRENFNIIVCCRDF